MDAYTCVFMNTSSIAPHRLSHPASPQTLHLKCTKHASTNFASKSTEHPSLLFTLINATKLWHLIQLACSCGTFPLSCTSVQGALFSSSFYGRKNTIPSYPLTYRSVLHQSKATSVIQSIPNPSIARSHKSFLCSMQRPYLSCPGPSTIRSRALLASISRHSEAAAPQAEGKEQTCTVGVLQRGGSAKGLRLKADAPCCPVLKCVSVCLGIRHHVLPVRLLPLRRWRMRRGEGGLCGRLGQHFLHRGQRKVGI
mmetsp:Transcript_16419/g.44989  ORF Transcript_16419/g.44989 Transcript_16419/m.44989 type:complete len:253 (-) Transcript_16419:273-1031(-)